MPKESTQKCFLLCVLVVLIFEMLLTMRPFMNILCF